MKTSLKYNRLIEDGIIESDYCLKQAALERWRAALQRWSADVTGTSYWPVDLLKRLLTRNSKETHEEPRD